MSDTQRISDDERAYLDECRQAVDAALLVRDRFASYLLRKYGITGLGRIQPDGTIEARAIPELDRVDKAENEATG